MKQHYSKHFPVSTHGTFGGKVSKKVLGKENVRLKKMCTKIFIK